MVSQTPKFAIGSVLALTALAALSCGGDSKVTNNNPATSDPAASCAQHPGSTDCTPPANGNAPSILVMVQPPPMSTPATPPPTQTTTTPPTAPMFPMFPRAPGAAGTPAMAPTAPTGTLPGAAGAPATPPPVTATAGATAPSAGAAGAGSNLAGIPDADLDKLRQTCVDEINMYRATLTMANLMPMKRASAAQEACSDMGAQMDGDSMQAHGAAKAGVCRSVGLGAENTCPGWPVGGRSGNATLEAALKSCLKSMWAEGEPPVSRAECQQDYQNCFLKYGHYLNMSDPNNKVASCGFYKMKSGAYWMNQDFAFR